MAIEKTMKRLKSGLSCAWSAETCWPPMRADWVKTNPAHGQCLVTALLTRRELGGHLVMGYAYIPDCPEPVLHFRNRIDGQDHDLTWQQFPEGTRFEELDLTVRKNQDLYDECVGDRDTQKRYRLLSFRVATLPSLQ